MHYACLLSRHFNRAVNARITTMAVKIPSIPIPIISKAITRFFIIDSLSCIELMVGAYMYCVTS